MSGPIRLDIHAANMRGLEELRDAKQAGNEKKAKRVRDRLVAENLGLVNSIAKRQPRTLEFDDLMQAGAIGLQRAIDYYDFRHDPRTGKPMGLGTVAQFWIRHEMQCAAQRGGRAQPRTLAKANSKANAFYAKYGRFPEPEELGFKANQYDAGRKQRILVSYDALTSEDSTDSPHDRTITSSAARVRLASPERNPEEELLYDELSGQIERAIDELPPSQRRMLVAYFHDGDSTEEIRKELSIKRESARRGVARGIDNVAAKIGSYVEK